MHSLSITDQGTEVHVKSGNLLIVRQGKVLRQVRMAELHQVLLFGRVEVTSAALAAMLRQEIDVVLLTLQGSFRGRITGKNSQQAQLRLQQMKNALDPLFCSKVTKSLLVGKINHQRQILLRAQRRLKDEKMAEVLGQLRILTEQVGRETDLERLRGYEGRAAALYFSQFGKLLLASDLTFAGRSRRPPRDPVNACLSFGYALLGTIAETEVLRCGLDPMIGFLHQPAHGRPSLMLDIIEEFRPLIDGLVLRLVNRRQLGMVDFERKTGKSLEEILAESPREEEGEIPIDAGVALDENPASTDSLGEGIFLGETGRRIFLKEFYARLRERLYYPPRQGSFELREILRQQIYHLARVIQGEDDKYVPFVPS